MRPAVSCPGLIGRDTELGLLEAALRRMIDGDAPAVVVSGEAGIGKSRLLRHFLESARDQGVHAWMGHCVPIGDAALPYAPLLEILGEAAHELGAERLRELAGPGGGWLAALVPALAGGAPQAVRADTQAHQLTSLSYLLDRLAGEAAAIVVEDLHWADQGTLDLLSVLVRARRRGKLLIVCSYRDDELGRGHPIRSMLAEWQRCGVERIGLARLDHAATAAQIAGILGRAADPASAGLLYARSGGNPFLVEELVAAGGHPSIPEGLKDLLLLRFQELPEAARQAGRVVALVGAGTDHDLLEKAIASPAASAPDLAAGLSAAVERHVLVHDGDAYAFRHALVAEAVAQDMLPADRRRLHRRVAEALAARVPDETAPASVRAARLAQIAHHWYAGRDTQRAFPAAVDAALAAEEIMAFRQAQLHYQHALTLWPEVRCSARLDLVDLVDLCEHAAEVAYRMDDIDGALDLINRALGAEPGDARAGLLHFRRGRYMMSRGDSAEATLTEYRAAVRLVPAEDGPARVEVLAGLAATLMTDTRYAESESWAVEAVAIARRLGSREYEAHALGTLGADQAMLGRAGEGLENMRAALGIATRLGGFDALWRAYVNLSDVLHYAGLPGEAADVATAGIERLDRLGTVRYDLGSFRAQRACLQGNRPGRATPNPRVTPPNARPRCSNGATITRCSPRWRRSPRGCSPTARRAILAESRTSRPTSSGSPGWGRGRRSRWRPPIAVPLARRARISLAETAATEASGGPFGLTPREAEVLDLLTDGYTNRQIARELFISEKTVSIHVSRILAKMNVPNRSTAAAAAHRHRRNG